MNKTIDIKEQKRINKVRSEASNIRHKILNEHKNKCDVCGALGDGYKNIVPIKLVVHHKRRPEEGGTNDSENLLVLCHKCHSKIHNTSIILRLNKECFEFLTQFHETNYNYAIITLREKYNNLLEQNKIYKQIIDNVINT